MRTPCLLALGATVLASSAACGGTSPAPASDSGQARTVAAKGELTFVKVGAVRPSFLITQEKPFTTAQVSAVRTTKGVSKVALIGIRQVAMYDRQLATAAVDPLTFRPFTYPGTANSAPLWEAVRRGTGLISHEAGTRDHLPLDATLPVGGGTVRLSGLATTVPGIDLVVSVPTGRTLGVPFGNGMVVGLAGAPRLTLAQLQAKAGPAALVRKIFSAPTSTPTPTPRGAAGLPPLAPSGSPAGTPAVTASATPSPRVR
ncbi:MAG: hypothetical protein ABIQ26_23650 [Streptosporangiaceae bacterium]